MDEKKLSQEKDELLKNDDLSNERLDLSELENVEGGKVVVVGCGGKGGGCTVTNEKLSELSN